MVKRVQVLEFEKSQFVKWDQAKYTIKIVKNKKDRIRQLHITYREYPLYDRGYDNYQELNVKLTKLIKYTGIEMYYLRGSWNGDGYDPVCYQRLQLGDEFFNFVVHELETDSDVRNVVIQLFRRLKDVIESSGKGGDCHYATYYFPV